MDWAQASLLGAVANSRVGLLLSLAPHAAHLQLRQTFKDLKRASRFSAWIAGSSPAMTIGRPAPRR